MVELKTTTAVVLRASNVSHLGLACILFYKLMSGAMNLEAKMFYIVTRCFVDEEFLCHWL